MNNSFRIKIRAVLKDPHEFIKFIHTGKGSLNFPTFTRTAIKIRYADEYGEEEDEEDESAEFDVMSEPPTFH